MYFNVICQDLDFYLVCMEIICFKNFTMEWFYWFRLSSTKARVRVCKSNRGTESVSDGIMNSKTVSHVCASFTYHFHYTRIWLDIRYQILFAIQTRFLFVRISRSHIQLQGFWMLPVNKRQWYLATDFIASNAIILYSTFVVFHFRCKSIVKSNLAKKNQKQQCILQLFSGGDLDF